MIEKQDNESNEGVCRGNNDDNDNKAKMISAIPMPQIMAAAAAAVMLGLLSLLNGYYYQPAMGQQDVTGGNVITATTTTSTGGEGGGSPHSSSSSSSSYPPVCTPTQMGGTFDEGVSNGGTSAFDDYDADIDGGDRNIADRSVNTTCAVEDGLSVGGRRSAADDYDGTSDS